MGFEPTTASLEGWNSTTELRPPTRNQLSSPYRLRRTATGGRNFIARFMTGYVRIRTIGSVTQLLHRAQDSLMWWAGKGSNLGSHKAADLQSAPFVHLGTCPPTFHSENKIQPCRQIEHISGSSLRETDGWIAEEN